MPEQRLLSPRSWLRDGGGSGRFLVPWLFRIEDLGQGLLIGEEAAPGGRRAGQTLGGRGPPLGRARVWCGGPVPPLWSLSCVLDASGDSKIFGVDFVRFREYFVTRISETKNSRKQQLALRHLVNRLVPENARI